MRLYNTIVVLDCYCVAETHEAAREAAIQMLITGELQPSESTAIEVRNEREVRAAWREEKPLVGADVSEADFAKLKGKTTFQTFEMLHKKIVATKPAKEATP